MKTKKRLLLGFLSSLLLAVGFVRVAERLEPMSSDIQSPADRSLDLADSCAGICDDVSNLT